MRVSVSCWEWILIEVYNWNQIGLMRAQWHLVVGQNKSDVVWNSHQRKHDVHGWAPQLNEHWGAWPGTLDKPMWPNSVLIVSLSDCQLPLSNDEMFSLHVLPKLKIWKLITSVQVDHSCRNSPCFNLCVLYLCNVIMLLPVLMMIYAHGVFAEINILLTLTWLWLWYLVECCSGADDCRFQENFT